MAPRGYGRAPGMASYAVIGRAIRVERRDAQVGSGKVCRVGTGSQGVGRQGRRVVGVGGGWGDGGAAGWSRGPWHEKSGGGRDVRLARVSLCDR
jgi:hypothetical protein